MRTQTDGVEFQYLAAPTFQQTLTVPMKCLSFAIVVSVTTLVGPFARAQSAAPASNTVTKVQVVFSGGYDTDPRDHGRPVVLIASALGVTAEVFREAFRNVHPAGPGTGGPTREEARANKAALMSALGKFGVTNERLDQVSNFYRYPPGSRDLWKHTPAVANALVQKNGVVTGYEVVSGGAGYSSPPTVSVPNLKGAGAKVELSFGKDLERNGSVSAIKIVQAQDK